MLSWKSKIQNMPNTGEAMEERRAFNDTVVALANNRVNLSDTIRLATHDAFDAELLAGGFIIPRMFSTDLIDVYKRLEAAKLEFFRELPEKEQTGKTEEYYTLKSKLEKIVKLCDKILENKDLQSILRNPKEVQRIARATAGSSEVSLYGRLRFVLRLTKGALSIGAVAAIVYFVYVWASTGSLPFFLSRYSVVLKPLLGKAREVVSGLTEKAASRAWDAAQAASTYADKAWNTTSSYANDAWDATANYTNNAWNATSAFREAAKNATSEAYANIKNTSLSDLTQSGYNYFLKNFLRGGDQDKKHLLFEYILFALNETTLHDHQIIAKSVLRNIVEKIPSRAGRIYQAIEFYPALPSDTRKKTTKETTRRVRRRQPSPRRKSTTKETVRKATTKTRRRSIIEQRMKTKPSATKKATAPEKAPKKRRKSRKK